MPIRAKHRRYKLRDAIPGLCRFCGQEIRDPTTRAILTRKTWHSRCVEAYKEIAFPAELRRAILKRDEGKCAKCGVIDPDWQADHITPLAAGGSFEHTNVQTLCPVCHKSKQSADLKLIREHRDQGKAEASQSSKRI